MNKEERDEIVEVVLDVDVDWEEEVGKNQTKNKPNSTTNYFSTTNTRVEELCPPGNLPPKGGGAGVGGGGKDGQGDGRPGGGDRDRALDDRRSFLVDLEPVQLGPGHPGGAGTGRNPEDQEEEEICSKQNKGTETGETKGSEGQEREGKGSEGEGREGEDGRGRGRGREVTS